MNREDVAWMAGVFEGEGSAYYQFGAKSPYISVEMTDEDIVQRFHEAMGFGTFKPQRNREGHKPSWRWQAGGFEKVQAAIAILWPWLGQRRQAQAAAALLHYHAADIVRRASRRVA